MELTIPQKDGISELPTNVISLTTYYLNQPQQPVFTCLLQQCSVTCYMISYLILSVKHEEDVGKTKKDF